MAHRYADEIASELDGKPFDRDFLDQFALAMSGRGRVIELGCGPGHVAAYLARRDVDASGLDSSAGMIAEARRLFPGLEAVFGDMLDLPFDDRSIAGLVAFYSIIHFDDDQLLTCFSEMARVLEPGGLVALAFHIGDEVLHRDQWWDMSVVLDARFLQPDAVIRMLAEAGLAVVSTQERDPYAPGVEYQSQRAYIVAAKPTVE